MLRSNEDPGGEGGEEGAGTAVAVAPPRVRHTATLEADLYATRARHIAVRHASGDRVVALIEVVSPGNKAARHPFRVFVEKAAPVLALGVHLLVIDLFPPGPRDPRGLHDAIWAELGGEPFEPPGDRPLTLASYCAGPPVSAYVEPVAAGDDLTAMPLFLSGSHYVPVPLDESYHAAFRGVPRGWRGVLEPAL